MPLVDARANMQPALVCYRTKPDEPAGLFVRTLAGCRRMCALTRSSIATWSDDGGQKST
jgi:hypothetical protein